MDVRVEVIRPPVGPTVVRGASWDGGSRPIPSSRVITPQIGPTVVRGASWETRSQPTPSSQVITPPAVPVFVFVVSFAEGSIETQPLAETIEAVGEDDAIVAEVALVLIVVAIGVWTMIARCVRLR